MHHLYMTYEISKNVSPTKNEIRKTVTEIYPLEAFKMGKIQGNSTCGIKFSPLPLCSRPHH